MAAQNYRLCQSERLIFRHIGCQDGDKQPFDFVKGHAEGVKKGSQRPLRTFAAAAANIFPARCEPRRAYLSPTELRSLSHGATAFLPRSYGLQCNGVVAHNEYLSFGSKNIERRDYENADY